MPASVNERREALIAHLTALAADDRRGTIGTVADALGVSTTTARGILDYFAEEEGLVACYREPRGRHGTWICTYELNPPDERGTKAERAARRAERHEASIALCQRLNTQLKALGITAEATEEWDGGAELSTLALDDLRRLVDALAAYRHTRDADCAPFLRADGTCTVCGVAHGEPCDACGGRGFHAAGCAA